MGFSHRFCFVIFAVTSMLAALVSDLGGETEIPRHAGPREQLVVPLARAPETLNPYLAWDSTEKLINGLVYESLLSLDPATGKTSPGLATQWVVDRENLVYTFKLKPGVRWQDGTPFTADDVVFSFEKVLDPATDAAHLRPCCQDIEEIHQPDELTVQFRLKRPYYLALQALGGLPIIPGHLFREGDFNRSPYNSRPVGTGPYKLASSPVAGRIVLQANENYHGPHPAVRKIVFTVAEREDAEERTPPDVLSFDPLLWVMGGGYSSTPRPAGWEYRRLPPVSAGFSSIMLNLNKPFFWDKGVRLAMAHLVDRKRILNTVLLGYGQSVESSFPVDSPYYNPNIKPYAYDPKTAQRLLTEAGWEESPASRGTDGVREKGSLKLNFRLYAEEGWGTGSRMAAVIREAMGRAGMRVRLEKVGRDELLARLRNGAFDAALVRLETAPHTDPYQFWHSSQAGTGYNFSRFVNAEADYLLERARLEDDAAKRRKYYARLQQVVHEEAPAVFLFSHQALMGIAPPLAGKNLNPTPTGIYLAHP